MRICLSRFWTFSGSALFWLLASYPITAQITPDTTLPNNSVVTTPDNTSTITGGTTAGENLFHSFREFSVPENGVAVFDNAPGIQNIISRVTGTSRSEINGIIQAKDTANLFFINPNGIIFGPNASLNIGGSFIASTANSLRFANGTEFSATNPQATPLLTVSVPVGIQFGSNPEVIVNQSKASPNGAVNSLNSPVGLQVPSGKTLALVGGNVILEDGNLTAGKKTEGSGRIELGSVGTGLVNLTKIPQGYDLEYFGVQNFQDINLSGNTQVDASGQGGGEIQVRGRNINLTDNAKIFSITEGAGTGGNLIVNAAGSVNLSGENVSLGTETRNTGSGGSLTITTRKLIVEKGAFISTSTSSQGQAGDLLVRASDSVELLGGTTIGDEFFPSSLGSQVFQEARGNGGNLTVHTGQLTIRDGAQINASTLGEGKAGNVEVTANDIKLEGAGKTPRNSGQVPTSGIFAQVEQNARGNAGNVTIKTQRLTASGGGQISAATFSTGSGGNVSITADDSIKLSGASPTATRDRGSSGIFVSAVTPTTTGNVGNLNINTRLLTVENGARISADNLGTGLGSAGNLTITANDIRLNGGRLTATTKAGEGANITLQNVDLLLLQNGSQISAAASEDATGGNIKINAANGVVVAVPGENQDNDILASAVQGRGGNINITASGIFGIEEREPTSPTTNDINASSDFGLPGTVIINRPEAEPDEGLLELPVAVVDASGLVDTGCAALAGAEGSNFFVTGRGGLPPSPDEPLSTDVLWSDTRIDKTVAQRSQTTSRGAGEQGSRGEENTSVILHRFGGNTTAPAAGTNVGAIVPATGWVFNGKGEVTLVSHASGTNSLGSTPATCPKQ